MKKKRGEEVSYLVGLSFENKEWEKAKRLLTSVGDCKILNLDKRDISQGF
jgi:hypothetical protein